MPSADATLSVTSAALLLHAAAQRGADAAALSQAAGLDASQLHNPDGRLPIATMQRLWPLAAAATADPYLDLHLAEHANPAQFGLLAYVLMHSPTLGAAVQQLCRYQDIACNGTRTSLRRLGASIELVVELTSPAIVHPHFVLNSELLVYLQMLRMLSGQPLAPEAVRLAYPAPADAREHRRVFAPAPVQFGTPDSALRLPAAVLELPVLNADPHLLALMEPRAAALLARLQQPTAALPDRVRHEIVRLLKGAAPTLAAVADALCLGSRTLQLHLRQAGHTYQQLLDEVRRELAEQHLHDQHHSTTDIAFLLGFAEPSVFVRSFKRWTGQTPGAFRRAAVAA
ncbi:AraC family transcriptional regulator [Hymenobacter sp. RP-2-7]|uniref:AraC family transcriptional regulator n=1 Tax=Hymenobacter polaris TaxID=2682546 RepID=A0A7Y0AFK9_9BACT|nr:AraC family transcriptional regulator [Hymenobacter polaris]NML66411.1 AraC family transcriptional regulator [Hymenobacter polaris]